MSDTAIAEPPVEPHPLLRRATDPKPQPPRMSSSIPPAAAPNGFSFLQVAILIGIAVFINGVFLLLITRRTQAPTAAVPAKSVVTRHSHKPAAARPVASEPAPMAETSPAVTNEPVAAVHHVASPPASPATSPTASPSVLQAPVIDTVEYNGPIIHMAWKSLGAGVTYKVYVMPNVKHPSFDFRFNKYGPSMDWFLDENKSWRYVAITVVNKNGKESPLSNIVDTTPSLPKPEY